MENTSYIHINQAARIYGKSRQTFYNYIKKGLVASKKVNNKLYLDSKDVEKIMNDDYIVDSEIIEPNTKSQTIESPQQADRNTEDKEKNLQELISLIKQQKNELTGIAQTHQQEIESKLHNVTYMFQKQEHMISKQSLTQRKMLFWVYYLIFVGMNIFVIWYIG